MSFYLIDGHSQIYRACFTQGANLTSPSGEPTRGTYYFCRMLFKLVRDKQPSYLAMAVDAPRNTYFRTKLYPEYKANRPGKPSEITIQRKRILEIVRALGICVIEREGFEADDIIASLAARCRSDEVHTYIVSRDKDLHQLLNAEVSMYDPQAEEVVTWRDARERWGVNPGLIADIQAIAGDSSDNIPGIKGTGVKGALELIKEHGSIQGLKNRLGSIRGARGKAIRAAAKTGHLDLMRQLTYLRRDVPLKGITSKHLEFDGIDLSRVQNIFEELGFKRWV